MNDILKILSLCTKYNIPEKIMLKPMLYIFCAPVFFLKPTY